MKKHFIISYIVIFTVFLFTTSCTSNNNNKSDSKEYNDTIGHDTPEKYSEEQKKNDMI